MSSSTETSELTTNSSILTPSHEQINTTTTNQTLNNSSSLNDLTLVEEYETLKDEKAVHLNDSIERESEVVKKNDMVAEDNRVETDSRLLNTRDDKLAQLNLNDEGVTSSISARNIELLLLFSTFSLYCFF